MRAIAAFRAALEPPDISPCKWRGERVGASIHKPWFELSDRAAAIARRAEVLADVRDSRRT